MSLDERANEPNRLRVLFLAYTGLRFGEMAALRVRRLEFERRRVVVAESVTPVLGQGLVWGTPKTHQRREAPIPQFLVGDLQKHIADKSAEDLVYTAASLDLARARAAKAHAAHVRDAQMRPRTAEG